MVRSGFREYEVKTLRSPVCSRQEIAIFPPHIHGTQSAPLSPPLYIIMLHISYGKYEKNLALFPSGRRGIHNHEDHEGV